MEKESLNELINIIDSRVLKYMQSDNKTTEYTGIVTDDSDPLMPDVRLAGSETEFKFQNKTNQILHIGDTVYVRTVGKDLNSGIITSAFKPYNIPADIITDIGEYTWVSDPLDTPQYKTTMNYVKWQSGKIEYWANQEVEISSMPSSSGNIYKYERAFLIEYPFAFKIPPTVLVTPNNTFYEVPEGSSRKGYWVEVNETFGSSYDAKFTTPWYNILTMDSSWHPSETHNIKAGCNFYIYGQVDKTES